MNYRPSLFALGLVAAVLSPIPAQAPASGKVGTIIVAHGGDSLWNSFVLDAARAAQTGGPVEVTFLMGPAAATSRFQDAVAKLEAQRVDSIVVVPVLVSSHSGHYDQIRWIAGDSIALDETMMHHLHMAGITRATPRVPVRVRGGMDNSPEVAEVLAERGRTLAARLRADPRTRALLIIGHGPNSAEENAAWMEDLRAVADSVRARTQFRDVRVDLVRDDAPAPVRAEAVRHARELIELQSRLTGANVIVVPVLVSKGAVSRDKLPADLSGTAHDYAGEPLLPHPAMIRWIERSVRGGQR